MVQALERHGSGTEHEHRWHEEDQRDGVEKSDNVCTRRGIQRKGKADRKCMAHILKQLPRNRGGRDEPILLHNLRRFLDA